MSLNDIIEQIFEETEAPRAFVEKDFYAIEVLQLIGNFQSTDKNPDIFFAGGTSLARGHNLIQRFSEDLDFLVLFKDGLGTRGERRKFRSNIINHIKSDERFDIDDNSIKSRDQSRHFQIQIKYKKNYDALALRPYIQLEMTFAETKLPTVVCDVRSLIGEFTNEEPNLKLPCISAIEIAGDKISALSWRILAYDREHELYDAAILRHLHDLANLEKLIMANQDEFIKTAQQSLSEDKDNRRGGGDIATLPPKDRLEKAFRKLNNTKAYKTDYDNYVDGMSYAKDIDKIGYSKALEAFNKLALLLFP